MAQRSRKEFRGKDYQRLHGLERHLDMVTTMDSDRSFYNVLEKKDYELPKELFATDTDLVAAVNLIKARIDTCKAMFRGQGA